MEIPEIVYEHYLKVPICKRPEFIVRLEEHIEGTFIHCDVFKWNKQVKKEILEVWDSISRLHGGPIYTFVGSDDIKIQKFMQLFGFKRHLKYGDGTESWIWSNYG